MNRRTAILVCVFVLLSVSVQAQVVFFINAGSRTSYGDNQELMIDANGNARYYLRELNGPTKDSSQFNIGKTLLDSIFLKAQAVGFFNLNTRYDGGAKDGAGIYISMNNAGRIHSVHVINTDVSAINEFMNWLNTILASRRIRINYGQNVRK